MHCPRRRWQGPGSFKSIDDDPVNKDMSGGSRWGLAIIGFGLEHPAHRDGGRDRRFPDDLLIEEVPDALGSPLNAGGVPAVEPRLCVVREAVLSGPADAVIVCPDRAV